MEALLPILPIALIVLACPLLMMFMMRGMHGGGHGEHGGRVDTATADDRVRALEEEVARLKQRITVGKEGHRAPGDPRPVVMREDGVRHESHHRMAAKRKEGPR